MSHNTNKQNIMIQYSVKEKWTAHGIHIALFLFTCIAYKVYKNLKTKSLSRKEKITHENFLMDWIQNKINSIN